VYTSTGTLNRILQENAADKVDDNAVDLSDDEEFEEESDENGGKAAKEGGSEADHNGDVLMLNASASQGPQKGKKEKGKGPRLERVLEDDEFIPELKQKNELLHK
jgi:hypothetical protein